MPVLKKLALAPVFFIIFIILLYQVAPLLSSYDFFFSLTLSTLINLLSISALFSLAGFLFILFATLASDLRITLPVSLLCCATLFIFIPPSLAVILAVVIFISLILTNLSLYVDLKTYLTFRPETLLSPHIRHLTTFLIISFCIIYFLSMNKVVAQKGFEIPDSLIDTALKMTPLPKTTQTQQSILPKLTPEQLELLKQNPDVLRQSGLDPKILDTLDQTINTSTAGNLTSNLIKQTVKDQIQNFIKPFLSFIPGVLAVLLFFTLQSIVSIINLLIYPLLWLTFLILEKTGFIKFEIEMREVKKLVV